MSQADTDGFTIVKAKSRRSHTAKPTRHGTHTKGGFYSTSQTTRKALQLPNPSVERYVHEISSKQSTLTKSKFHALLEPAIHAITEFAPEEIVCYGIGTLRSPVSQWQLALILTLNSQNAPIHAFDPIATEDDAHILCHFGVTPIIDNEMGKRKATKRTLFYMPHCEQFLYENTVGANWSPTLLGRSMVVGNHFSRYQEAQSNDEFTQQSPHIKHMLPHATVIEMPHESTLGLRHCPYAFSDMCIQHVRMPDIDKIDFSLGQPPSKISSLAAGTESSLAEAPATRCDPPASPTQVPTARPAPSPGPPRTDSPTHAPAAAHPST